MAANLRLNLTLSAVDRLSAPLRKLNNQIEAMQAPVKKLGSELSRSLQLSGVSKISQGVAGIGREVVGLTGKMAALAGVGGFVFKTQLVDTAAQFEKFNAILTTLEGSSEKAQKSMNWISDFASTTPFEFAEVTDAFVKLRSYGLDPTKGLMRSLGDTAAAMGKPLNQAVEAIADAVTGENERLKELGITSSVDTKKHKTDYTYIDNGKTVTKSVDNRNKAMIQSTLEAIWNSKYKGSMEVQSKTWNGMMSNLEDQITRTKVKIMNAGLFDWMKGKLGALLALVDRMAADGSLQRWAMDFGNKLQAGFEMGWTAGKQLYAFVNDLSERVGGFGNLAKISLGVLAAIMAGPLLLAVAQLTQGVFMLFAAFAANPVLLAIGLMTAAVVLLYKNWDDVVGGIKTGIQELSDWFSNKLLGAIQTVKSTISAMGDGIGGIVRGLNPFSKSTPLFTAPLPATADYAPGFANRYARGNDTVPVIGQGAKTSSAAKPADGKVVVEIQGAPVTVKSMKANSGEINVKNTRAGAHFQ